MTKITALIITLNEEKHIGACIDSLSGVADEVLVVDSFSTDKTKIIAEAKGAKVIESDFTGFGPQRNLGAGYAANDLILVLDADERPSDELIRTIVSIKEDPTATAYSFNRLNFIGARPVRSAGWYPDTHVRLYDRRKAKWNDRHVHEDLIVNGEIQFLRGDLLHYSYKDIAELKTKSTHYAKLGAEVYKGRNTLSLLVNMIVSPVAKFFKTYILKRGFTDGYIGFMISYYRSREAFLKYYWALFLWYKII
jgi:glycosyltransferase involved in cell wall biosynthesis